MSWWQRLSSKWLPIYDEKKLTSMAGASDEEKEAWHRRRIEGMKGNLDPEWVASVEAASDEDNEPALAEEIRKMKRRNPHEWELLLASLPEENQRQLRDIERRYGV